MCWELTGAQELRNSDFLQIFPVLLTLVSVTAEQFLHAGPESVGKTTCECHVDHKNFFNASRHDILGGVPETASPIRQLYSGRR